MSDRADRRPAELDASDPEPVGADIVAVSRALERAAARILESAGLDRRTELEIRNACEQLAADRTNGEALDGSVDRLRALVARYGQHPDPALRRDDGGAAQLGDSLAADEITSVVTEPRSVPLVVSVGSINADLMVRVPERTPPGGLTLVDEVDTAPGGKAGNVAVMATRLGLRSQIWGCIGRDREGELAVAALSDAGVDIAALRRSGRPTGRAIVVVPPDGDKQIILALGANDDWSAAARAVGEEVGAACRQAVDAVVVADLECPPGVVRAALGVAREAGVPIVLDPSPAGRVDDDLLAMCDYVVPDHLEAEELTGFRVDGPATASKAAEVLRRRGECCALVKLPGGGCLVRSSSGEEVVRAPDVSAVDTNGAGDAFAAGAAWAVVAGLAPIDVARTGVAAATCAVRGYGAQRSLPDRAALVDAVGPDLAARLTAARDRTHR